MPSRIKAVFSFLLSLGIVIGVFLLVFAVARSFWHILVNVNPQLAVAVVSVVGTIVTVTLSLVLGRVYERKKEIEARFREEKIKIYDEFLSELFKAFQLDHETKDNKEHWRELGKFFSEWQRKLILWAGSDVLRTYFKWMNRLKAGNHDAQMIFLMDDFFRALRSDIGQNSKGLSRGDFAHLILKNADWFLAEVKKNPTITFDELTRKEKELSNG